MGKTKVSRMSPTLLLNLNRSIPLSERLHRMHGHLLNHLPEVDRIACALYDADTDVLRTFINSTRQGDPLGGYDFKLSDSAALFTLSQEGGFRVLDDIPASLKAETPHSRWVLEQGYGSSFTVPMYAQGALLGFIFFDSMQKGAFTLQVQRDLMQFCTFINMEVAGEQSAVRSILSSIQLARDFANMRDFETGAHLERMARYSRIIAHAVAPSHGLSDEFVENIGLFAVLHDIGKIGIPDHVLLKRGPLDPSERVVMESHVVKGCELIEKIIADLGLGDVPDSSVMRNIVACHHEYLDGSGYPRGLKGDEVPMEARIVAVADIFDAMTSYRHYKKGWVVSEAMGALRDMAVQGKLDASCVSALEQHLDEIQAVALRYQDDEPDILATVD